ncbi:MAG: SUMF1/EgtB/PvdO family nonheme iron enzyme [Nitrospinae bacterium]|nr:SUMF1/EgtB/PvdO family nonheme iron enzyme [Nitrospinota bacterium]MBI5748663.1 SUMF1/EgtB/PvdO family nonheme iron enzyme [Nitrospinota bacterium]
MNRKIRRQKTEDRRQASCVLNLAACFLILIFSLSLTLTLTLTSLVWAGGGGSYDKGNEMVLIPEGVFLMGSKEDEGRIGVDVGVDEFPQREVNLKAFYIDKYEVTVGAYRKFAKGPGEEERKFAKDDNPLNPPLLRGTKGVVSPSILLIGGLTGERARMKKMRIPISDDDFPMSDVSYIEAEAYCKSMGKRLPTEEEWEKAARGTDGRIWPWGNKFEAGMANTLESKENGTIQSGSFPTDVSPYNVYDMAGNLMEWTSSWYEPYPGSKIERPQFGKGYKVMKGGTWSAPSIPFSRAAYRHPVRPTENNHSHRYGFRCAKDAG